MTVFKGFLQVLIRNIAFVILFTTIMVVMGLTVFQTSPSSSGDFTPSKPTVLVINRGNDTALTRSFNSYLAGQTKKVDTGSSEREIDDALYYETLSYVVYLPHDFTTTILKGEKPVVDIKTRASSESASAEVLVSRFLRLATGYGQYLTDEDELVKAVNSSLKLDSKVSLTSHLDQKTLHNVTALYNFGSYTLLAGGAYVITMILAAFSVVNIRKRTLVSPARPIRIDLSLIAGCALIVAFLVALNVLLVRILLPGIADTGREGLYALNIAAFGLPVLAIGFFIAKITNNKEALSAIVNVVALASAFLCGAFIPRELMPDAVVAIGRALPTFYYIDNNNALAEMTSFSGAASQFWVNIGVQVVFTLALWGIAMLITRLRRRA
ncbi:MAG: ABC transporter permease [Varibaculum cambriense]|uniref:ABC transporter permease n=1 Tax=Varibaculum cambriense TaxID=184870 RepID=UPI002906624E|nr:ABC transporter permease [Varibaculum cambriense]MDU4945594.1 ABC transporter permease [Varibaculum cambriense]